MPMYQPPVSYQSQVDTSAYPPLEDYHHSALVSPQYWSYYSKAWRLIAKEQSAHPYHPNTLTPAASPPTAAQNADVLKLRSGTVRRSSPAASTSGVRTGRVEKPTPRKKKERMKAPRKVANIQGPLSIVTKDFTDIPVTDIATYVARSSEERQREVEEDKKEPGRIKRPMNAFMLYRKAYQNRAKVWCSMHNHQVVSQVCGDSWPLEPEDTRNQFVEWARQERENHQKAHPGYKFTPAKPRKKGTSKDEDEMSRHFASHDGDGSELDEYEEWLRSTAPSRNSYRIRNNHTPIDDNEYMPRPGPSIYAMPQHHYQTRQQQHLAFMQQNVGLGINELGGSMNRSDFHFSNPGKAAPAPYDEALLMGAAASAPYYQQTIARPAGNGLPGVSDVMFHKTPSPSMLLPDDNFDYNVTSAYMTPGHQESPQPQAGHLDIAPQYDPAFFVDQHQLVDSISAPAPVALPSNDSAGLNGFAGFNEDPMLADPELLKVQAGEWHVEGLDGANYDDWQPATPTAE
jgi:hypothetical protein